MNSQNKKSKSLKMAAWAVLFSFFMLCAGYLVIGDKADSNSLELEQGVKTGPAPMLLDEAKYKLGLTTHIDIFLGNLTGRIQNYEQRLKVTPESPELKALYAKAIYQRALYKNNLIEIEKAISLVTEVLKLNTIATKSELEKRLAIPTLYIFRAKMSMSLHRFASAQEDLAQAQTLGAPAPLLAPVMSRLNWNLGAYGKAGAAIRQAAQAKPGLYSLLRLARLDHKYGQPVEAHNNYLRARAFFSSNNPIEASWIYTQHGIHKLENREFKAAKVLFEKALLRAPDFVLPLEHLAETLHKMGRTAEAIAIYKRVTEITDNPEFIGALAALYKMTGQKTVAKQLLVQASKAFKHQLKRFPNAMYWHGANFFLGEGAQPDLGIELLKKNITIRPSSGSWLRLAEAYDELGRTAAAQSAFAKAQAMETIPYQICKTGQTLLVSAPEKLAKLNTKFGCQ